MSLTKFLNPRRLLPIVALLLLASMGYALRSVLVALTIGLVAAYLLNPTVSYLHALRVPRRVGAFAVMLGFIGFLCFVIFSGVPGVVREIVNASARLPGQFDTLRQTVGTWLEQRFHMQIPANFGEMVAKFGNELRGMLPNSSDVAGAFTRMIDTVAAALSSLIVPIFVYYFLTDFDGIVRHSRKLIPRRFAPSIEGLVREIDLVISRYVRGQATKSIVLAVLYAVGLRLVGMHLAIPIGIITGILTFIPYVGVAIGFVLVILMTVLDWQSLNHLLAVLAVMGVIGVFDSQVITPRVIGGNAPLKSIEVLLAMIGAFSLFGPVGVLFAVPLGAVVKILVRRLATAYTNSAFYLGITETVPDERQPSILPRASVPNVSAIAPESAPRRTVFTRLASSLGFHSNGSET